MEGLLGCKPAMRGGYHHCMHVRTCALALSSRHHYATHNGRSPGKVPSRLIHSIGKPQTCTVVHTLRSCLGSVCSSTEVMNPPVGRVTVLGAVASGQAACSIASQWKVWCWSCCRCVQWLLIASLSTLHQVYYNVVMTGVLLTRSQSMVSTVSWAVVKVATLTIRIPLFWAAGCFTRQMLKNLWSCAVKKISESWISVWLTIVITDLQGPPVDREYLSSG